MQTSNHPGQKIQNPSNQARKLLEYFHSRPGLCKRQKPFIMQKYPELQNQEKSPPNQMASWNNPELSTNQKP